MQEQPQFFTIPALSGKYSAFTPASLRWLAFNRGQNGFNRCVVRVGRRVLIDETEFVAWLRDQREKASA